MTTAAPCLILLDCQMDQVQPQDGKVDPENQVVIDRIATLLHHARNQGWTVCHSQQAGDRTKPKTSPIKTLRPTAREAVFVRPGLSAFSDPYFHQVLARNTEGPCLLAGFSAPFSMLATVFDAQTRGQALSVVTDAVGSLAVEPRNVAETRAMAFDLIGRISPVLDWDTVSEKWLRAPVDA
ncbi:isochorismatase family protein [Maricaulis parjimensis]|uniref:isochorismatase family protein n=1 Tax=Maricaulis parjimensis TaxID=144023 RepID=UPI0019394FEB|nr:isochorismatase family protein [Maricaulis parjimensis]